MATVAPQAPPATASSRSSSIVNGHGHGNHGSAGSPDSSAATTAIPSQPAPVSKKPKGKKTTDPNETSKLLAAKITQLELDATVEKDQEVEIGWCSPFGRTSTIPLLCSGVHRDVAPRFFQDFCATFRFSSAG
jgi:hypothetical protein